MDYFHRISNEKKFTCVGGWSCPHCGPNREWRKIIRKAVRRIDKQQVKQLLRSSFNGRIDV